MKKRIIALLLTVVMVAMLLPVTAFADGIATWAELQTAINNATTEPTTIVLTQDLTADSTDGALTIANGQNITIDLKGFTLDRGKTTSIAADGYVIKNEGTLTITDTSTAQTGKITGGNNSSGKGGGVYNTGDFTLVGGSICDNTVKETNGHGGGVYNAGDFIMKGDSITGNSASGTYGNGGGVFNAGRFDMTGGEIRNNNGEWVGGVLVEGPDASHPAQFLIGGTAVIMDNVGTNGGPIPKDVNLPNQERGTIAINIDVAPADGMYIGLQGENTAVTDATSEYEKYFFADKAGTYVKFDDEHDQLVRGNIPSGHKISIAYSAHGKVYAPQYADKDAPVSTEIAPEENYGLKSLKWNETDITADKQFDMPDSDVTLTAVFDRTYTVSFDMRSHGTQVVSQTILNGGTAVEPVDPTADGYTFGGWYSNDTFSTPYAFDTPVTADTTLYAKWSPVPCTVKFDLCGHGAAIANQVVLYGSTATEPTRPTADGYTFVCWCADKECNTSFVFNANPILNDTTLYAKWTKNPAAPAPAPAPVARPNPATGVSAMPTFTETGVVLYCKKKEN